jgi:hypothetical protein
VTLGSRSSIVVWDTQTFDDGLRDTLTDHLDLITNYVTTEKANDEIIVLGQANRYNVSNEFSHAFQHFLENTLVNQLQNRTIRGWHYTRLCNHEIDQIKRDGITVSSLGALRTRLNAMVNFQYMSQAHSDDLYSKSPYHDQTNGRRLNMFWMTSYPLAANASENEWLFKFWGGEAVYFNITELSSVFKLQELGSPRILDVTVPLANTNRVYCASRAIVSSFAKIHSLRWENPKFDFYSSEALPADFVSNICEVGDSNYEELRKRYLDLTE